MLLLSDLWQFLPSPSSYEFAFQYKDYYHRNDPTTGKPFKFASIVGLKYYCDKHNPLSIHIKQNDFLIFDIDKDPEKICPHHPTETRMVCNVCWENEIRPQLLDLLAFLTDLMDFKQVHVFDSGRRGVHVWARITEKWDKVARLNLFNQLERRKIHVDKGPLLDPNHLIKVPFMPHAVTGYLALKIEDPKSYVPSMRVKKK